MNKRKSYLELIKIAGYHGDNKEFTRLLIASRINREEASQAYVDGAKQKESGVKCACSECNK